MNGIILPLFPVHPDDVPIGWQDESAILLRPRRCVGIDSFGKFDVVLGMSLDDVCSFKLKVHWIRERGKYYNPRSLGTLK